METSQYKNIRFEHRGGRSGSECIVLMDLTKPEGQQDVATAWEESEGKFRWRMNHIEHDGTPYPLVEGSYQVKIAMSMAYVTDEDNVRKKRIMHTLCAQSEYESGRTMKA